MQQCNIAIQLPILHQIQKVKDDEDVLNLCHSVFSLPHSFSLWPSIKTPSVTIILQQSDIVILSFSLICIKFKEQKSKQ